MDSGLRYELKLSYNSTVWSWHSEDHVMRLGSKSPVGLGFRLHMGRIYKITVSGLDDWFYEDPTGTSHKLKEDAEGTTDYFFSQDSTYIRALKKKDAADNLVGWDLWLPDGTHYELLDHVDLGGGSPYLLNWHGWYTTWIRSSLSSASWVHVEYDDPPRRACIQRITDSVGRVINFTNASSASGVTILGGYTTEVRVPAFGPGVTAVYGFEYSIANVRRPGPNSITEADELLLSRLSLPEPGFDLTFGYADPNTSIITGPIRSARVGLGGPPPAPAVTFRYDYDLFWPNTDRGNMRLFFQQQVERRTIDTHEGDSFTWTFARRSRRDGCEFKYIVTTDVTDPYSNTTRYDFTGVRVDPECDCHSVPPLGGEVCPFDGPSGLPTNVEYYHGPPGAENLVREEARAYSFDFSLYSPPGRFGWNVRMSGEFVKFSDNPLRDPNLDPGITIRYGAWDGFHFREQKEYDLSGNLYRVKRTLYDVPAEGTEKWENWVLNTYAAMEIADPIGVVQSRSDFTFADDGRLCWRRDVQYALDVAGPEDTLTVYTYDGGGNLASTTIGYWSDVSLTAGGTGCPTPTGAAWTVDYGYQYGYRSTAQVRGIPWKSEDLTIDPGTGLVAGFRDPNGISETYDYDVLGRLRAVIPSPPEAPTYVSYPSGLEVVSTRGLPGSPDYVEERRRFDSLGRLVEERRIDPDSAGTGVFAYVKRLLRYEGPEPRVVFSSEWVPETTATPPGTTYSYRRPVRSDPALSRHDPFGRVQEVRAADDPNLHVRTYTYVALDSAETVCGINNDPNAFCGPALDSSKVAITAYERDAFGRLIRVTPPAGAAVAEYEYDLLDRLTKVTLKERSGQGYHVVGGVNVEAPGSPLQVRMRSYDLLGRLQTINEPESGPTTFDFYDARGNVTQVTRPDGTVITQSYDAADRLAQVSLHPPGGGSPVLVAENLYDQVSTSACHAAGKLTTERSFDEDGRLVVERKYGYCGMNGRLSRLTTIFPEWVRGTPAQPVELSTSFVYDNFGRVKDIAYPLDGSSPRVPTTVTNTFVYGHLASVTSNRGSIVPSFNWNPAGGLEAVTSGNGVETSYGADILNRPQRIEVRYGATTYLDTGAFGYDGAGNVTELGADTYRYDLAGRLTSAQTSANHQAAETFDLSYTYDLLGSMTMFTKASGEDPNRITVGRSFEVDPSTNHLLTVDGAPVDYESGNLLFDGYLSFSWDKRSRLRSVGHQSQTLGEYDYDSGGVRVRKSDQTAFRTTYYVRGPGGEVLSEYSKPKDSTLEPHWNRDYVYMGRRLLAVVQNAKPLEPTGITSSASSTTVHLSWARNAEPDIYGYSVYRTTTVGAGYQKLNASLTILGTSFDDTSPLFSAPGVGVPTYYVITAVDSAGLESRYSAARLIIPADMTAPGAPTALSATAGDSTVTLSWTPNSEEDLAGYDVYRSTTSTVSGGVFGKLNITPLTSASFTDFGLTNGTTYYYKLKAVDTAANSSSFSVEVLAVPNSGGGGDPENPPPKEAHLRWDNPGGPTAPFASSPRFIGSHSAADADWEILFVHADHLGSTRVVTLEDGIVLATEHYFPFGESMPPQNPSRTGKGFTGHERDDEAGLYYMLARPYSPHLSRFPVPDPLGSIGQTGGPSSNAYTYALNNPTNYLDVDGREPTRCLFDPLPGLLPGLGGMDEGPKFPPVPSLTTIPFSSFTKEPTLCNMNPEGFCPNLGAGETAQPWLPEKPGAAMPLIETEVDYHPFGGALIRGLGRAGPSIARMAKRAFNAIKGWFRRGGTAELQSTVKISPKIARQMSARGWTREMIEEAIAKGQRIRAVNKATGGPATRYVHPKTGQSVVIDDVTGDVLHVGEPWFRYGPGSGDLP